jgi:diguanylate cyclase (GGDEF)-like protein/PAS domain S-box-containing protein
MPVNASSGLGCPPDAVPAIACDGESAPGLARITALAAACLGMPMAWLALGTGRTRVVRAVHGFAGGEPGDAAGGFRACVPLIGAGERRLGELWIGDRRARGDLDPSLGARLEDFARLAAERLDHAERSRVDTLLRGFAEAAVYALMTVETGGTITFANTAAEALFGYAPGTMIGQDVGIVVPASARAAYAKRLARFAAGRPSILAGRVFQLTARHRDGSAVPLEMSLSLWSTNGTVELGLTMRDISEWHARDAQLVRMAHHDNLTGLLNRARFNDRLRAALTEAPATVMLLDLDGFKEVNDSLGHATGDALLQSVAVRLPTCVAPDMTVARLGGDEFAILLPACGDPIRAAATATGILDAFQATFHVCGHTFHVGLSVGIAVGRFPESDAETLIADADLALYQAKRDGRRCCRLFEPAMRSAVLARRTLHDELSHALEAGEFVLHYQPQVAFATGQVVGAEALLRWRHPARGLLLPGAFLCSLEAHPMAAAIGRWIIEEACRQAAQWRAAGLPPIRVAVNLFAAQLQSGTLAQDVTRSLARYRLPTSALELEVTERIALQAEDAILEPIRALHAEGVAVAFDDFGTGYASLSSLKRFPLTRLKIDRSFVRDVLTDRHDAEIIRAILLMAQSFGLEVIAEGIEGADQETVLRTMGCHEGQGYLYGRAVPPAALAALIRARTAPEACAIVA